ncbi:MAG: twin-arginine translocase subunit TatC [Marinilabiliaceae bacterium]|nr:twin-arginine translocase subunit TatC [Marinilabiliaceae bacterium]
MSGKKEMSFLQHLEALRWHLIRGFIAVAGFSVIAFLYKEVVFDTIIFAPGRPDFWTNVKLCQLADWIQIPSLCINQQAIVIKNIAMSGQFMTHLWVSFIAGVIIGFPYFFWEIWRFIQPALYEKEARYSRGAIIVVSVLFFVGIIFGYYIISPLSISFLSNYQVSPEVANEITISSYISTISSIVFSSGVLFELPVFIFFLAKLGIVSSGFLKKYRRHAIVAVITLAAIITPPDVFSQLLISVPMLLLYEASVIIAKRLEKKRNKNL